MTLSDSTGFVVIPNGLTKEMWNGVYETKAIKHGRLSEWAEKFGVDFYAGENAWKVAADHGNIDVAFPSATQNEITLDDAKLLVEKGTMAVVEGANMPSTLDAIKYFTDNKVLFGPA